MKSFLRLTFLFSALLLSSLVSHGPYVQMAGILLLCGFCLCLESTRTEMVKPVSLLWMIVALLVITSCFLYFIFFPAPNGAPELEKSAFNNYLFLVLVTFFVMCVCALMVRQLSDLIFALAGLIVVNDLILLVQTACLIATNTYIDLVEPVTGEPSRFHNYESLNPVFAYRPTGLFVEPSTFSAVVAVMTVGYVLLCRARASAPRALPLVLTLVAMLVTQSTAATVQCGVLLIAVLWTQKKSTRVLAGVIGVIVLMASPSLLQAYFDSFAMKMDETSAIRLGLLNYIYHVRSGWDWLVGYGPFTLEGSLYHLANPNGGLQVASLNDAGLFHYFVVRFGILGLAIPALIFVRMRKDVAHVLFFALIMSLKLSYTSPVLFLGLLPLLMRLPAHAYGEFNAEEAPAAPLRRAGIRERRSTPI
jgi:hypothetical protein